MKETTAEKIVALAKELHQKGCKWHFHMLLPDCQFNEKKDKHAFVLEDESGKENYVALTDERMMREGEELVRLIYGAHITHKPTDDSLITDQNIKRILRRAKAYNDQEIQWHHHMLYPNCKYNPHPGKYCIYFEDPIDGSIIESVTDEDPKENLQAAEYLYYQQKN